MSEKDVITLATVVQELDRVHNHLSRQDRKLDAVEKALRESGLSEYSAELADWLQHRASDEAGHEWLRRKLAPIGRPSWWLLRILIPAAAGGLFFTLAARLFGG